MLLAQYFKTYQICIKNEAKDELYQYYIDFDYNNWIKPVSGL